MAADEIQSKFETVIFKKKTLGNLIEEVYNKSNTNEKLIIQLIQQLQGLLEGDEASIGSALTIAPLIAAYMKLNLDTNEQLIKMLSIVQKCLERAAKEKNADGEDTGGIKLTEAEKEELRQLELEYTQNKVPQIPASINELKVASKKSNEK